MANRPGRHFRTKFEAPLVTAGEDGKRFLAVPLFDGTTASGAQESDPNSAEMEAEAINTYERGDWNVKLRAWCRCRCTPTEFLCEESFEAWDGGKKVFDRTWQRAIPRRLV